VDRRRRRGAVRLHRRRRHAGGLRVQAGARAEPLRPARHGRLRPRGRPERLHHHVLTLLLASPVRRRASVRPGYDCSVTRLFDTHAHLPFPDLAADLDAVLARARAAGVVGMVTIGTDGKTNEEAVALAERLHDVYATVGIHPHDAEAATEADWAAMQRLARAC